MYKLKTPLVPASDVCEPIPGDIKPSNMGSRSSADQSGSRSSTSSGSPIIRVMRSSLPLVPAVQRPRKNTSVWKMCEREEDVTVNPFVLILSSLRLVQANFLGMVDYYVTNTSGRDRFASTPVDKLKLQQKLSAPEQESATDRDARRSMALEVESGLLWSIQQVEIIKSDHQICDAVSSGCPGYQIAIDVFMRVLRKEMKKFAGSCQRGPEVAEYLRRTYLEPEGVLPEEQSEKLHSELFAGFAGVPQYGVDTVHSKELSKCLEDLGKWGIDLLKIAEYTNNRPLTCLCYKVLKRRGLMKMFGIRPSTLLTYLMQLEDLYRKDVSYHNSLHAADVVQTIHVLLSAKVFQNVFSNLEMLAIIFAAAIHDVDHPGLTNQYLVNTSSDLALMYNDKSVLENHHLAVAFKLLQTENCDIFSTLTKKERQFLRKTVISLVLATDMTKHISLLADLKTSIKTKKRDGVLMLENYKDRIQVLQNMLHCADLSNPTKPLEIYRCWVDRIMDEFFRQGDLEREQGMDVSPMCDRLTAAVEKTQVGFIDYVVHPLWEAWAELVYPDTDDYLDILEDNREWYNDRIPDSPSANSASHPDFPNCDSFI